MKKPVKIWKVTLPLWGWILAAVVILGALGGGTSQEEIRAQEARDATAAEQYRAQQAVKAKEAAARRATAEKAEAERKANTSIEPVDLMVYCKEVIKKRLKLPDTARYPGFKDALNGETYDPVIGKDDAYWKAWVEAENSFGGKVRNQFYCTYKKATNTIDVQFSD